MATRFIAVLRGADEVPPVRTAASGDTVLLVSDDQQEIRYQLTVHNIQRMTQAHIHIGGPNENGPVVAWLFGPQIPVIPGITVDNGIVTGTITRNDLVGPLANRPLTELIRHMANRNTYVNVHTVRNPAGEIRGQIRRAEDK